MSTEPVLIMAAINAVIALVVSFGFHLTSEQVGAINAAAAAVLGVILRTKVSPVNP